MPSLGEAQGGSRRRTFEWLKCRRSVKRGEGLQATGLRKWFIVVRPLGNFSPIGPISASGLRCQDPEPRGGVPLASPPLILEMDEKLR
jgi:hypothetical protein